MLLVGTTGHLEDLDRQLSLAEDVVVTAIAPTRPIGGDPPAFVLLDAERIVQVDGNGVKPVGVLEEPAGQCLAAGRATLIAGLAGARLAQVDRFGGAVTSVAAFLSVPGRVQWENPAGPTPDLRSATVTDAGTWLVNVHVGGVWRSADEGASWASVIAPEADVHEVVAGDGGTVVVAAARGVGWSIDDGATWEWTADGLHAPYCRAAAVDGDRFFVTASTGPTTGDARLFRGAVGRRTMEPCDNGVPPSFPFNLDTGSVDAHQGQVALGVRDGRVYRSSDGGDRFEQVTERVGGRVRVVRFA